MRGGLVFWGLITFSFPQTVMADITRIADLQRNQSVTVVGVVDHIPDEDEIMLRDESGKILVYLGPNATLPALNETVRVTGMVDDDGPREINATSLIRADGTTLAMRGYE